MSPFAPRLSKRRILIVTTLQRGTWLLSAPAARRWSVWGGIPTPERGNDQSTIEFDKLNTNGIYCVADSLSPGGFGRFLAGFCVLATKGAASCW